MKTLEKEFVMNADKRGDNRFVQIKRNEYAALYQRFAMDGTPLEYEVFQIKVAGGTEIFGRFYEKYEAYPGASAFGRTAWSTTGKVFAEKIFDEITRGKGKRYDGHISESKPVVLRPVVKGKRGRRRTERPEIILPKKKFSIKDLVKVNPQGWTQPTLYLELTKLVKTHKVVEAERKQTGRGRPMVFYKVKA